MTRDGGSIAHDNASDLRVKAALDLIARYGGIQGEHHKAWLIDQIVRALTIPYYDAWIAAWEDGEDGPRTYEWDTGIAP